MVAISPRIDGKRERFEAGGSASSLSERVEEPPAALRRICARGFEGPGSFSGGIGGDDDEGMTRVGCLCETGEASPCVSRRSCSGTVPIGLVGTESSLKAGVGFSEGL